MEAVQNAAKMDQPKHSNLRAVAFWALNFRYDVVARVCSLLFDGSRRVEVYCTVYQGQSRVRSCDAQGFLIYVGNSMMCWYISSIICFYRLTERRRVPYNTTRVPNKNWEPFLHGISILIPLLLGITALSRKGFNTYGAICFLEPNNRNPRHCVSSVGQ